MEHVRAQIPDLHITEIIIRAYANQEGLSKVYVDNTILETASQFVPFVRGFNSHALCDYIDAGKGKECSDEKLRGMLISVPNFVMKDIVGLFCLSKF
jgi:hypothetical protein